jgi:hypothetical protein
MMRYTRFFGALIPITLLISCVEESKNYLFKPGISVDTKSKDFFECKVAAATAVPANTQIDTTPIFNTPVQTNCYSYGYSGVQCSSTGGQVYGGDTYSYDANAGLRQEHEARCMAARGYRVSQFPVCAPSKVPTDFATIAGSTIRPPKEGSCIVVFANGGSNLLYPEEAKQ